MNRIKAAKIILDIIFVYPLDMGMAGASIASIIGAACTTVILLFHFFSKTNGLRFKLRKVNFKTNKASVEEPKFS